MLSLTVKENLEYLETSFRREKIRVEHKEPLEGMNSVEISMMYVQIGRSGS